MDYAKLKALLREYVPDEENRPWTDEDDNRFSDEIFNVQLEKVTKFQHDKFNELRDRVDGIYKELKGMTPPADSESKGKERSTLSPEAVRDIEKRLDEITNEVRELKRYSNLNYTGFLKIVKKHDRKRGREYKLRPLMRNRLAQIPFNSEKDYSPLLTKLSRVYEAIHQYFERDGGAMVELEPQSEPEIHNGERYTAHKCTFQQGPPSLTAFVL